MTSIHTRHWKTPTGKSRTAYRIGFRVKGKRLFRQFARRKDAARFLEELSANRPLIEKASTETITVDKLARLWLAACRIGRDGRPPLDDQTIAGYEGYVRNHIVPRFGTRQVHTITKADFRQIRDELTRDGLTPITVKKILGAFKSVIQHGIDLNYLETHPGKDVRVRGVTHSSRLTRIPSVAVVKRLLDAADQFALSPDKRVSNAWTVYRALLYVLAGTGIRLSEARGLRRQDVGLDCIFIRQRSDRAGKVGKTKSVRGVRDIYCAPQVIARLKEVYEAHHHELVFASRTGRAIDPQNIHKRMWQPVCEAAGATGYGIHSLRHYFASRIIAAGQSAKEVSVVLGHADEGFTLATYGHLFQDRESIEKRKRAALDVLRFD